PTVETRIEMDADIQPIAPQPQQVNSPASEGAASERRRSPRQALLTKAMLRGDAGPARPVELRNLSFLGVRFRAPEPLSIGDKANIKLEVGPLKWNARLRVVHCAADESGAAYTIGCAFIGNELARSHAAAA